MVSTCKGITQSGEQCHRKTRTDLCHQHRVNFMQLKPEECIICLENIAQQKRALECGHWIHKQCIINSAKAECPLCRTRLHLGPQALNKIDKLAQIRAKERIEEEEEELLAEFREEILDLSLQEHIHNIVSFLLDGNNDISFVDVIDAIFEDYDSTG